MSDKICGRDYRVTKSIDPHPPSTFYMEKVVTDGKDGESVTKKVKKEKKSFYVKPKSRIIVEGINHPLGQPIRFKTLQRAENHIKNFRLEVA